MKASAEKTSVTSSTSRAETASPFFRKAGEGDFFAPTGAGAAIQAKLTVNKAGDKFEQEAERMADKVMRAPAPATGGPARGPAGLDEKLERNKPEQLLRKETGPAPSVDSSTQAAIGNKMTGGQPLSNDVRSFMEPRFGADFSAVRVHTDTESAGLSNRLSARAFTHRNHVFFSNNQYQPGTSEGKQLLAHELTHTIQQGHSIQRSPQVTVAATSTPSVQRLGVQDALDYFADKAYYVPGFRLLSIVLGFNPISGRSEARSAANILRALIELIPGGALIAQALESHGVFTRAGAWVEQQLAALGNIGSDLVGALMRFVDSLSWTDIFDLGGVWDRAKAIFLTPIARLVSFGAGVVTGLMAIIREVILRPLASLAEGTAGYDLLKAVLGQDPITGEAVPRSPALIIGGFMKLIGQEEVWQNIQKGNAIGRAWEWFQGALAGLMGFVRAIPGQIIATLTSITWQDVVTITGVFTKVGRAFLNVAGQFFSWAGAQVISLLEIIFFVVAPGAVPYIKKAQGAFRSIIQNPIGFVGNLVRAGKKGFQMFASNIGEHLKTALIKWITGPLGAAGVYIPKSFNLIEVVKLVLSVLGLTWQNIRSKLVKIIPEPVLVVLEKTAGVLVTLVRDGPAAAWQEIKNEMNELKDSMIAKVTEMVTTEIVKAAIVKLVSMLNPAGAVIQAIIAIYNTITFFIQKINQIAAVVGSFIDSVAAIAAGQVDSAAKRVEQTMANTLVVIIAFLAKFAGLGGIPEKLVGVVMKIRAPMDKGMDKVVAWLGVLLKKIGAAAKAGVKKLLQWWKKKVAVNGGGQRHTLTFDGEAGAARLVLRSKPQKPVVFLRELAAKEGVKGDINTPITGAQVHQDKVENVQKELKAFDDDAAPATTETATAKSKALSESLDLELSLFGAHIGSTLTAWDITDPIVPAKAIKLPRGKFTFQQKSDLADAHSRKEDLVPNSKGKLVNVSRVKGKELARRHVVSSHDVATHYEAALNGKKVSQGKLLLEQRPLIGNVGEGVTALTIPALQQGATARYAAFFGYTRNLFIGDSRENSAIQEKIDPHHPLMARDPAKLAAHVQHVKRAWAIDGTLTVSGFD